MIISKCTFGFSDTLELLHSLQLTNVRVHDVMPAIAFGSFCVPFLGASSFYRHLFEKRQPHEPLIFLALHTHDLTSSIRHSCHLQRGSSSLGSSVRSELHVLAILCIWDDVSHCQGWLIWEGWKKKPSQGIAVSHRQLWNVFTEGLKTFKDKFGSDYLRPHQTLYNVFFFFNSVQAVYKSLLFPVF